MPSISIWRIIFEEGKTRQGWPRTDELLREDVLPALGQPKTEIVRLLGVSRQLLYDILAEKQPVTPAMALKFGKLCGNGPDLWLNLQRDYDLAEARLTVDVSAIPNLNAA